MRTKLWGLVGLMILSVAPVHAQTITLKATDKLQWDQGGDNFQLISTWGYSLIVDSVTSIPIINVTCTGTADPWICVAPIPALAPGTHTLMVSAGPGLTSNLVMVTVPPPPQPGDPRCVFPTGDSAIAIFPTRFQVAGQKAVVHFQLGASISPVTEIRAQAKTVGTGLIVDVGTPIKGENLDDVGALWFRMPTGMYTVILKAKNAYGCATTLTTSYVFTGK